MADESHHDSFKIAAVTVLYNPDNSVIDNVKSYVNQVDVLCLVDNSDFRPVFIDELLSEYNVIYIANGTNLGIARALNIGAERAISDNCKYLLTMDQDSSASPDMISTMMSTLDSQNINDVAILCPFHSTCIDPVPENSANVDVLTVWTSGNLLNLDIYKQVGTFRDDFFIDFVDFEYCLRLKSSGFRIIKVNSATLEHKLGTNLQKNRFLFHTFTTSNHSSIRRYYITRNRFWVWKQYGRLFPDFLKLDFSYFCAELVNIFLFETDRARKFYMISKGLLDFIVGRMGRLQ